MITPSAIGRLAICGLSWLGLALTSAQALDLTPRPGFREGNEGPPTPVMQFSDGQGRIEYQPPSEWRAGGGGRSLVFFTPEPTSWMRLIVTDKGNPAAVAGVVSAKEDLQTWAATFAPAGAEKLQPVKTVASPFALGAHASTEFLYTCTLHGYRLSLSVSVIDISAKERLVMLVCAEPGHFEQMREKAISSMFTWSPENR